MMKNVKIPVAVVTVLYAVVLFVTLWLVWYGQFYYVLKWIECYTFYSSFKDMTFLGAVLPADTLKVVGAWLMQFYYYPAVGAAIQAFLPVLVFLAGAVVTVCLFQETRKLLWLPLIPVAYVVANQFWDHEMTKTLMAVSVSWGVAVAVFLLTLRKRPLLRLPAVVANIGVAAVATVVLLCCSVFPLAYGQKTNRIHAFYCQLECLAEDRQWDALLALVPPGVAQESFIARRFALLALIEKGRLVQEMFLYGVTSGEDFVFKDHDEPLCRHFNALFYRSMNMPNEVIRQSFQQQIQSTFGTNFNVLRRLSETCLEMKNYPLTKKYLDILSRSTAMKSWVNERRPQLEAIKNVKPVFEQRLSQFYSADLLVGMGAMADRYPNDRKYADVLLCALLANKDGNQFYPAFKVIAERQYAHGKPIPRYYEQALMLVAPTEPEVLQRYKISPETQQAFQHVMQLVNSGQKAQLQHLLPNSFWAYFF